MADIPESRPTVKDSSSILEWAEIAGVDRSVPVIHRIWCAHLDMCLHQHAQGLRFRLLPVLNVPSAQPTRPANAAVVLVVVLGSRIAEMPST